MTGRQFEDFVVDVLSDHGYWAHRISPDEAGQQPFDMIALKSLGIVCAFDAKVLSTGYKFPLSRIEENQLNAFEMFKKKVVDVDQIGLLIFHDGGIRYLRYDKICDLFRKGEKSVDVRSLPVWECL